MVYPLSTNLHIVQTPLYGLVYDPQVVILTAYVSLQTILTTTSFSLNIHTVPIVYTFKKLCYMTFISPNATLFLLSRLDIKKNFVIEIMKLDWRVIVHFGIVWGRLRVFRRSILDIRTHSLTWNVTIIALTMF